MTTTIDRLAAELAPGERVLWSGRSRPGGAALAAMPGLCLGTFAMCLSLGVGAANLPFGAMLSPLVDSTLRTVSPLPVPQILIERTPSDRRRQPGTPSFQKASAETTASHPAPPLSDVDIGVGAFLMACKTLMLFLGASAVLTALRAASWQGRGIHAVTNARAMTVGASSCESLSVASIQAVRRRGRPFGTSVMLESSNRRRPFVMVGLRDGRAAAAAVAQAQIALAGPSQA